MTTKKKTKTTAKKTSLTKKKVGKLLDKSLAKVKIKENLKTNEQLPLKAKADSTGVVTMEVVEDHVDPPLEDKVTTLSPHIDPETGVLTMVLDLDK